MKHAYLILAHHEFAVLKKLVSALDDERNDIYIHFDKKVAHLPQLITYAAKLYVLEQRIDVRWGHVSILEAELMLFREANTAGPYAYYHLLSGVDFPLCSQKDIHEFFIRHVGKEFIGYSPDTEADRQTEIKIRYYHQLLVPDLDSGPPTHLHSDS